MKIIKKGTRVEIQKPPTKTALRDWIKEVEESKKALAQKREEEEAPVRNFLLSHLTN